MHPEGPAAVWAESLEEKKQNENYLSSAKNQNLGFHQLGVGVNTEVISIWVLIVIASLT